MLWKGQRESENVEDRRGISGGKVAAGGGILTLIIAVVVMALGGDPSVILGGGGAPPTEQHQTIPASAKDQERKEFVSVVLADTEDVWQKLFQERGQRYQNPKLVLFTDSIDSACGIAGSAVGPFYCPEDTKIYIDLSFYDELRTRFGASGEFAQAYVIAHEVGHHVQKQMGILQKVNAQRSRLSKEENNRLSVRLELQADYLAGVWAHHAQKMKKILDRKDLEDAIRAAGAIGDDRLQKQSRGYVVPESFTHGTSEQRIRWFRKGWDSGDMEGGNTFSSSSL